MALSNNQPEVFAQPNSTYVQMNNKQKMTIVEGETFENDFDRFIIDATDRVGNYVVEDALNEMTCQGVDTSILVDGETPEIAEVAYNNKRNCNFIYKIREDELRNASNTREALDALYSKINANLDEQDRKNSWRAFPYLISNTTNFKDSQFVYNNDPTDYASLLLAMRSAIGKLRTPTDLYNSYTKTIDEQTYTLKTFTNRPIIFIKSSLLDEIEVNFESGVFNLDKIRIDADIIRVPMFYKVNPDFNSSEAVSDTNPQYIEDDTKLFLACGQNYVKIFKHFEKRATLEDVRSFNVGKAVTYIEYVSLLVPAIFYMSGEAPTTMSLRKSSK